MASVSIPPCAIPSVTVPLKAFRQVTSCFCVEPVVPRRSAGQCNYLNGRRCADAIACALEYKALILKAQLHPVSGANA